MLSRWSCNKYAIYFCLRIFFLQNKTTINNTESGKLFTWGYNEHGELGNGNTSHSSSPCLVDLKTPQTIIQCGLYHTVSLSSRNFFFHYFLFAEDGSVWSWGLNDAGRVGNGKAYSVNSVVPECVSLLKGKNVINLWSMGHSTIVLCDGTHILNIF
jgi:hypothetical protein